MKLPKYTQRRICYVCKNQCFFQASWTQETLNGVKSESQLSASGELPDKRLHLG